MNDGERQVAPTLDGIRKDHVERYKFALSRLTRPDSVVLDFACGVGYGSYMLGEAGHRVIGFDIDAEAIAYARMHYESPHTLFLPGDGTAPPTLHRADLAVCFETIEHIEDPRPLLRALHEASPALICSVPNEDVMPWRRDDGTTIAFHFRHYNKQQICELLRECGWFVTEWWGQIDAESEVEPGIQGRTLVMVARHLTDADQMSSGDKNPVVAEHRHIVILGLGPSLDQYTDMVKRAGGRSAYCDEVWSINALGDVFAADLVFHMDDVRIQEIRAAALPQSNIATMLVWIKTSKTPVMTSRAHPDYPALIEYPLEDVLNDLGFDYFNSTAAYAVAFAIHTGATKISLFGMDYTYPNVHDAEKGRACVEFWVGKAHERGIQIGLPKTSTLLDSMYPRSARLYGYDTLDMELLVQEDGRVQVRATPRDILPTAAEIEANYDHSKPIVRQHLSMKE